MVLSLIFSNHINIAGGRNKKENGETGYAPRLLLICFRYLFVFIANTDTHLKMDLIGLLIKTVGTSATPSRLSFRVDRSRWPNLTIISIRFLLIDLSRCRVYRLRVATVQQADAELNLLSIGLAVHKGLNVESILHYTGCVKYIDRHPHNWTVCLCECGGGEGAHLARRLVNGASSSVRHFLQMTSDLTHKWWHKKTILDDQRHKK